MIILGLVLIAIALLVAGVPAGLLTLGEIVLVVGLILAVLGAVGHPVGGRRYWF